MTRRGRPPREFDSYFVRGPGCWLWTGETNAGGYGLYRKERAHRKAFEREHGPIPDGLFVCHSCDTPPCVRPSHLFLGTAADNTADMMAKGRGRFPGPRRTTQDRDSKVCALYEVGFTQLELSDIFEVSQPRISQILKSAGK